MKTLSESIDKFGMPIYEARGEGSIYTLILFAGCDLPEILHCSHFATDDVAKLDDIISACDEYFKGGVASKHLEFNEQGVLGKEDQPILKLTNGDPYKELHDKLSGIAKYKYKEFLPHVSVTSNVAEFSGDTSYLVVSADGKEIKRYPFSKVEPEKPVKYESVFGVNKFGIPLIEEANDQ